MNVPVKKCCKLSLFRPACILCLVCFYCPLQAVLPFLSHLKVWWETCKIGLDAVSEILEQPSGVYNILYDGVAVSVLKFEDVEVLGVFGQDNMVYCWWHTDIHLRLPVDRNEKFSLSVKQSPFPNVFTFDLTLLFSVTWQVGILKKKSFGVLYCVQPFSLLRNPHSKYFNLVRKMLSSRVIKQRCAQTWIEMYFFK